MNYSIRWKCLVSCFSRKLSTVHKPQSENIVEYLNKSEWRSVVGLEVHVQIASLSKLFSGAKFDFTSPVNGCVSLFDSAIPGTLPVLNQKCVEAAVLTALALNCKINHVSRFHRKHYFYSDLPAGYQITQYDQPIAKLGQIKFNVFTPGIHKTAYEKVCNLTQVQLEQDSGKTIHDDFENRSLVDLNRAGVALMELVFDPDLSNGEEAAALVKELILILQCIGTSSCKMEEGSLRVDANVSVTPRSSPLLGTRSEVKNIGSIRGVANAVNYEIVRQVETLQRGEVVVNETRAYDAASRSTVAMRDKENIQDYRFMPDPNLLPLKVSETLIQKLKASLPPLPNQLRSLLQDKYKLNTDITNVLSRDTHLLHLFYNIVNTKQSRSPKMVAFMLVLHVMAFVNKHKIDLDDTDFNSDHLGDILDAWQAEQITKEIIIVLLEKRMIEQDTRTVQDIIEQDELKQIGDVETVTRIVQEYIRDNEDTARTYTKKSEKKRVKLFGSMMRSLAEQNGNRLNMMMTKQVLETELKKKDEENG
uniref:Glutamyl-tRNA(Gln) amidotransferase subunit B, mitochondrial n=2 Tax=Cacopsylla melanoneura TaxID=428564 RepID=A0A8D8QD94_9HEMI